MKVMDIMNVLLASKDTLGISAVVAVILLSLVQVSPIHVNPWTWLLGWVGRQINGETTRLMTDLRKQVIDLWVNNHRQSILTFARECRADQNHSTEEWSYIMNFCEEYEDYCKKNSISNGVIRADTEYIRTLYHQLSMEHKL